jgi:hypothetical protein
MRKIRVPQFFQTEDEARDEAKSEDYILLVKTPRQPLYVLDSGDLHIWADYIVIRRPIK